VQTAECTNINFSGAKGGIWSMKVYCILRRRIRFAKPIVQDSNLEEGSEVNIRTRNGNIIIEPVGKLSVLIVG